MGTIHVVVGGGYGSEAKGHITGWLARTDRVSPQAVIRVAGPNAGHSAYDMLGRKWALRQVPVAAVTNLEAGMYIAAGSEIDPAVLEAEVTALEEAGIPVRDRLFIHPSATVIEPRHHTAEQSLTFKIGSTAKGIGAARADRIMRSAKTWWDWEHEQPADSPDYRLSDYHQSDLRNILLESGNVIIEGTQGYGLGLHTTHYPYATSSDCRAVDFLAMAGLSPWMDGVEVAVWPVFRTYPIRVAGNSGPMYRELDWAELAERTGGYIQPERTTVTNNIRRIGEWDSQLAQRAMRANGAPSENIYPVLMFVDYVFPELAGVTDSDKIQDRASLNEYLLDIEDDLLGTPLAAIGTGPNSIIPLRKDLWW